MKHANDLRYDRKLIRGYIQPLVERRNHLPPNFLPGDREYVCERLEEGLRGRER